MFGGASQGGEQGDQLYFGMLVSLIAFLWSAAEYLPKIDCSSCPVKNLSLLAISTFQTVSTEK